MNTTDSLTHHTLTQDEEFFLTKTLLQTNSITKMSCSIFMYLVTNYINGMLVFTYFKHPMFYENPRYVLFIHMVFNDIFEMSVALVLHIWLEIAPFMGVPICYFFLILAVTTTLNTPLNLAVMALERYVAICNPLRHAQICTLRRTYMAIAVIWFIGLIPGTSDLFIVFAVEPLSFFKTSVYCIRENFFRSPAQVYKRIYIKTLYFTVVWLVIVFTYLRIVYAARSASMSEKSSAKKARNTILLHGIQLMLSMLTFIAPFTEYIFWMLPSSWLLDLHYVRFFLVYILPRTLSPVIYGMRDENFRKHFTGYQLCSSAKVKPSKEIVTISYKD
ncbi:Blue-sensitive opsin P467 [Acipenser ruthenus]|uniref:Blue-sensitive opsin P467 n=1 Tax=Acipenser ruthenus TaxID=7906 RepID=A0A444UX59_ACIRT|nr:Blue-sensitive opsin P467 [Acipenser ruthenus]